MSPLRELSSVQGREVSEKGMRNIDKLSKSLESRGNEIREQGYHEREKEIDKIAKSLQRETGMTDKERIKAKKEIGRAIDGL